MRKIVIPDRSKDCEPPKDRNTTVQCQCGKRMVGRIDKSNAHQGWLRWYWWCGCGNVQEGGVWHPVTEDEAVYARWEKANSENPGG